MQGVRALKTWYGAWLVVALVAMLSRALIPSGYMPAASAESGGVGLMMCSGGSGLSAPPIDWPFSPDGDAPSGPEERAPCAFALATVSPPPEPVRIATSPAIYAFEAERPVETVVALVAAWPPQAPPTGPPISA